MPAPHWNWSLEVEPIVRWSASGGAAQAIAVVKTSKALVINDFRIIISSLNATRGF
jgi:hypothetical protein